MKRLLGYVLVLVLALAATGCASTIPYAPKPTSAAPDKQVEESLNLSAFPPAKFEITDTYLKVVEISAYGAGTGVVKFSAVSAMKLSKLTGSLATYRVEVEDSAGGHLYTFWFNDLGAAQRFIDALAALKVRAPKT
jgi:hypothetical protein